jgi:hypothetical protein
MSSTQTITLTRPATNVAYGTPASAQLVQQQVVPILDDFIITNSQDGLTRTLQLVWSSQQLKEDTWQTLMATPDTNQVLIALSDYRSSVGVNRQET